MTKNRPILNKTKCFDCNFKKLIRYKKFVACDSKKSTFLKEIKKKNWAFQFFTKNVFELIKACKLIAQAAKNTLIIYVQKN